MVEFEAKGRPTGPNRLFFLKVTICVEILKWQRVSKCRYRAARAAKNRRFGLVGRPKGLRPPPQEICPTVILCPIQE